MIGTNEPIDLTSDDEEPVSDRHTILEPIPTDISDDITETTDDEVPPTQCGTEDDPIQFGQGKCNIGSENLLLALKILYIS